MCLIVDTNVAARFFGDPDPDLEPLKRAVLGKGCCLVYGGELRREYMKLAEVRRRLAKWDSAGKARAIPDAAVDARTQQLESSGALQSDDPHILALAQEAGSRLLCSEDKALHEDFTNPVFLQNPRGKIYQNPSHVGLLARHCRPC